MSTRRTTLAGLLLLTAVSLFQGVGAYALDWNKTHTMKFTATKGPVR
jgi:hypothetical protein